jgi:hypothetical protein
MFVVNDWLIRQGPVEQFDFNYQPIANQIEVNWVVNQVQSEYYYQGGNKTGLMRDEQYTFFIRWIYNTGERSSSYHIPGRPPELYNGTMEDAEIFGNNVLDQVNGDLLFKVYNTASTTSSGLTEPVDGAGIVIARGKMGYWQSTERYPTRKPDIWNSTYTDPATGVNIGGTNNTDLDLCGKFIRHHKMPTEELGSYLHLSSTNADLINVLGVEFANIKRPKYNDGSYIENVVGYELLRGSRQGARSILAKGIFRNMREYSLPNAENLIGGSVQGLYPNHPYNDLRPDPYFHTGANTSGTNITKSCDSWSDSISGYPPLSGYSKKVFTFASPELMFTKPFLNAYETRLYGQVSGKSSGYFIPSEEHPQFKLLRGGAAIISAVLGVGFAMQQIRGSQKTTVVGPRGNLSSQSGTFVGPAGGGNQPGVAMVGYLGGTISSNIATSVINEVLKLLFETAAGVVDLYTGGALYYTQQTIKSVAGQNQGDIPGVQGGYEQTSAETTTPLSSMPLILRAIIAATTSRANIALGGNEMIELFYNLIKKSEFAWKYNSYGLFNRFDKVNTGLWRIKNTASNYLGSSFQMFDSGNYKVNNLFRPETVAVALLDEIADPDIEDRSRFCVGGYVDSGGTGIKWNNSYLLDPKVNKKENISAHYGALKFNFDNQYGQLDGIKQTPMRGCLELLDPDNVNPPLPTIYTSKPIFSGDTFIGRYTEKSIMPIFSNFLLGQPDEFTFDYSLYVNIPYPRFWLNSQKYDITPLADEIIGFGVFNPGSLSAAMPGDLFYLDRGNQSCGNTAWNRIMKSSNDPNPMLAMEFAYMYTHTNGILDFYVESEINLDQRDWEDHPAKQIYDVYNNNDIDELFHAKIEKSGNFYKYDESLSPSKFVTQLSTFGAMQTRDYDPVVSEQCFVSYPKRLIYSLQAQEEARRDFWRVYLPFNYKDFKNAVSVIKPINKSGALVFFPYLSPQMFQGLDTLKTDLGTKLTIGDGGLFSQPFQNIANADISNEYGSLESLRGVINTPMGLFFISQAQGKIFSYAGKGLDPISNKGMKWWFNKYLPSSLVRQFPLLEHSVLSDNPVYGVGCQTIYDPNNDIVYFCKRDYKVKSEYIVNVSFTEDEGFTYNGLTTSGGFNITIGDPLYFDDCSWTISYDPKAKAWISFHDWHPELALPSINHFFTTKTITGNVAQCPPGYNYNPTTLLCEQGQNTSLPATIDIQELGATITGGVQACLLDIVIAVDFSTSTLPYNANPAAPGTRQNAQQQWLQSFISDPQILAAQTAGTMQIGFTAWASASREWNVNNGNVAAASTFTMSNTYTPGQINSWMTSMITGRNAAGGTGGSTSVSNGFIGAQTLLNNKAGSQLGDRSADPAFTQIIILITDTDTSAGDCTVFQNQSLTGNVSSPTNQFVYGVYAGVNSPTPLNQLNFNSVTSTGGPATISATIQDPYQYGIQSQITATYPITNWAIVAQALVGQVCSTAFTCNCPAGYTLVYPDSTGAFNQSSGTCTDVPGEAPICRKVSCSCPTSPPGFTTTITGTCPDSAPLIFNVRNPNFISDRECNYFYFNTTSPNYSTGGFWRHNARCDGFANFYNVNYPWEIDLISNTGQSVNTIRSIEYQLETYVYKNNTLGNACGEDKWEDLEFNFDHAIIYNNDQVSGLLNLNIQPYNNPWGELTYPIINTNNIDILASKVEHKFRFNQFWDITNDRGEFTNAEQPIFNTHCNGYIRPLNSVNLNYQKSATQRKKFRHYSNQLILRKNISGNRKMLLRLSNTKLLLSKR